MEKLVAAIVVTLIVSGCTLKPLNNDRIKLYAMNCGTLDVSDMSVFSSDGKYHDEKIHLVIPCFLIRHPKGDLLWDTGNSDEMADNPDGVTFGIWHYKLKTKLTEQLAQLNLAPSDIEYLSLSHAHPDHSGNANLFSGSTFIVNELEQQYMFSDEIKVMFGGSYSALENANTLSFTNEHDVFGDGTLVIKSMPGHTPGSSVLLIRLENSGNILLTGDLYTHARARELKTIFTYNTDKDITIDSRQKFEALVKDKNARVIIQHEKADFDALPTYPAFLD